MKKSILFFSYLIATIITYAQSPSLQWAKKMGGTFYDEGRSIAVDASGNVYTTGTFGGTVDFDPGTGTFNLTSVGQGDIFISKLNASGNLIWAKNMGGTDYTAGYSIAVDGSGNVYTTGEFSGTTDFDPGTGAFNITASGFNSEIFILKLDASGNFAWAKNMGGTDYSAGNSIAVDASGNVYTTGYFYGTTDFDPSTGLFNLTAISDNIFISKLNTSGNFVWAKHLAGIDYSAGYSIAVDASGNVYTSGQFIGTVDFDPGTATSNLTSVGFDNIFISKINASGNFVWAKNMGGTDNSGAFSIAVNASGDVYTTGIFYGTVDFDPGSGTFNLSANQDDIFISKLNTSGNFVWAKKIGGTDFDGAISIALDASGNVYTTGVFTGTVDFDPGAGTSNLTASGIDFDIFISKLDASGSFVWAKSMGGTSVDIGYSVTVDVSGNVYTTGLFMGTADFDPNTGVTNLTAAGDFDIFVHKMSQCNVVANITPATTTSFCQGDSVILSATTGAGLTYQWKLNNTNINGAMSATYIAKTSGNYTVVISNTTCSTSSAATTITVNALPNVSIAQTGLTLNTTTSFVSYKWYKNGTVINGAISQNYTVTQNGNYYVIATDANGCTNQSNTISITTLSLTNIPQEHAFSLYPNPNKGTFTITGTTKLKDGSMSIFITDMAGRAIMNTETTIKTGQINKEISLKNIPAGMYFANFITHEGKVTVSFVVQ